MKRQNLLTMSLFIPVIWGCITVASHDVVVGEEQMEALAAERTETHYIDPVCNRQVTKDTPHTRKIDGKVYHLCSEACKRAFKKEMVEAPIVEVRKVYIDPVCGCKVGEDTPYVAGYKEATYHFCSIPTLNMFLSSPKDFSCFCAEGERCPHRQPRIGKPCRKDRIPGYGLWSKWACPRHHTRFY